MQVALARGGGHLASPCCGVAAVARPRWLPCYRPRVGRHPAVAPAVAPGGAVAPVVVAPPYTRWLVVVAPSEQS